jgi:hypothetical protein
MLAPAALPAAAEVGWCSCPLCAGNMMVVLLAMGGYGAGYLGWQVGRQWAVS